METVERVLRRMAFAAAVIAGIVMLAMTVLITWQTVQRGLIGNPLLFIEEYSGYMVLVVLALGAPLALLDESLLRVDFLIDRVRAIPRRRIRLFFDIASLLFSVVLTWQQFHFAWRNHVLGIMAMTPMMTPIAVPQAIAAVGFLLLSICLAWKVVAGIADLFTPPDSSQEAQ